jgi:hypothetical protein
MNVESKIDKPVVSRSNYRESVKLGNSTIAFTNARCCVAAGPFPKKLCPLSKLL